MKNNKTPRTQGTPQQFLTAVQDKILELGGSNEPSGVLSSSTTDKLRKGVAMKRGTPDQFKMELTAKIAELGGDIQSCESITASDNFYEFPKYSKKVYIPYNGTKIELNIGMYIDQNDDEYWEVVAVAIDHANHRDWEIPSDKLSEEIEMKYQYPYLTSMDEEDAIDAVNKLYQYFISTPEETLEEFISEYDSITSATDTEYEVDEFISSDEDIDPGKLERYIHNLMGSISDLLEEEGYNVGFDDNGTGLEISIYPISEERCDGTYTFPKSALQIENGSDTYTDASNIVEILMGRAHFEDLYASTEIVASDDLVYDDYDFDVDGDEYDWSEEWAEVKSKSVPDSDGFMTDYTMYRNRADGTYIFMFGDKEINTPSADYADWSAETEEQANEWFDNYNGFDDYDEDVADAQLFDEIPEVQNFKQAVNDAHTVEDIELLIQGLSDGVAEDYVTTDFNSAINETDDIGQIKYAVVNSISLYLEDNKWLGDADAIESATVLASDSTRKWYGELLSDSEDTVGQEYGSSYEEVKQKLDAALTSYLSEYEEYDEDERPGTSEFQYVIKEVLSFRQAVDAVKEIIDPYDSYYKKYVEDAEDLFDEDDYWLDEIDWYDVCYAASEEVEDSYGDEDEDDYDDSELGIPDFDAEGEIYNDVDELSEFASTQTGDVYFHIDGDGYTSSYQIRVNSPTNIVCYGEDEEEEYEFESVEDLVSSFI